MRHRIKYLILPFSYLHIIKIINQYQALIYKQKNRFQYPSLLFLLKIWKKNDVSCNITFFKTCYY